MTTWRASYISLPNATMKKTFPLPRQPFPSALPRILPPLIHIWDVMVCRKGSINSCATVLCTRPIIMVHNGTNSSYRSIDWIGLWSCFVYLYLPSASVFSVSLFNLTATVFVNRIRGRFYLEFDFWQTLRLQKVHTIVWNTCGYPYVKLYLIRWSFTHGIAKSLGGSLFSGHSVYIFFIARQHTDARYWYSKSVRPSVCPSVRYVPVLYENGLTYYHTFYTVRYSKKLILILPSNRG